MIFRRESIAMNRSVGAGNYQKCVRDKITTTYVDS